MYEKLSQNWVQRKTGIYLPRLTSEKLTARVPCNLGWPEHWTGWVDAFEPFSVPIENWKRFQRSVCRSAEPAKTPGPAVNLRDQMKIFKM